MFDYFKGCNFYAKSLKLFRWAKNLATISYNRVFIYKHLRGWCNGVNNQNASIGNNQYNQLESSSNVQDGMSLNYMFFILLKRWWVIALVSFITTAIAATYSIYFITPIYSSTASMYVYRRTANNGLINDDIAALTASSQLINDISVLVRSRLITEKVVEKLGLEDKFTYKDIEKKINASSFKQTRVISITVEDPDKDLAALLANTVAEVFEEEFPKLLTNNQGLDQMVEYVNMIGRADPGKSPIKPNKTMNVAIAMFLGIMLSVGIIFLIEYFDDTVKSPESIQMQFGINILGVIPVFNEE